MRIFSLVSKHVQTPTTIVPISVLGDQPAAASRDIVEDLQPRAAPLSASNSRDKCRGAREWNTRRAKQYR